MKKILFAIFAILFAIFCMICIYLEGPIVLGYAGLFSAFISVICALRGYFEKD